MSYLAQIHNTKALKHLEFLISRRLLDKTDKAALDREIWQTFGQKWAIVFTDLAGFSRLVAEYGIIHFLQNIYESQRIFEPAIESHHGQVIKVEGDSMLILFKDPKEAVTCTIEMQKAAKSYNADKGDEDKILLCAGIGYGDILYFEGQEVFGTEVNAASKLGEDTAKAWEILVTDSVAFAVIGHTDVLSMEKIDKIPPGANAAFKLHYHI